MPGATYSFVSLHFITHVLVLSVVMCYQLMVSTPTDVSKIAEVKYLDRDIYVENVTLSGDLIALPFEGYGLDYLYNDLSTKSASRRVRELHCTWLVPYNRASSDDVDEFLTLRRDPLKEGRSTWRACPNRLVPRGTQISYSAAVDLVAELGETNIKVHSYRVYTYHGQSVSLFTPRPAAPTISLPSSSQASSSRSSLRPSLSFTDPILQYLQLIHLEVQWQRRILTRLYQHTFPGEQQRSSGEENEEDNDEDGRD
ncbi:hypothetical protein M9H77_29454 [Catharanthus roseus]|uniref:Uncharacterized protein n=1 Tax=Catharanthus roseus TaxID=4058 RepID=A0ACB9ZVS0_CATRO|nr:hypothetical protein M9H77_29454 [Catharanthus roseus]